MLRSAPPRNLLHHEVQVAPEFRLRPALARHAQPARANLTFNLIPEAGTPQIAIDGFTAAANRWSSIFADNITVNVQIGFSSLGSSIIGQTGAISGIQLCQYDCCVGLTTNIR